MYEIFLRGTLDKIGVSADFLSVGEYKSAPNQLTETGFTPPHREMSQSLNRDMYDQLVRGIAEARKKTEPDVRALLDQRPFDAGRRVAPRARGRAGLRDQLDDKASGIAPDGRAHPPLRRQPDYQRVRGESSDCAAGSRIAVIYAVGTIASGRASMTR